MYIYHYFKNKIWKKPVSGGGTNGGVGGREENGARQGVSEKSTPTSPHNDQNHFEHNLSGKIIPKQILEGKTQAKQGMIGQHFAEAETNKSKTQCSWGGADPELNFCVEATTVC